MDNATGFIPIHHIQRLFQWYKARLVSIISRHSLARHPSRPIIDQHIVPVRFQKNAVHHIDEAANLGFDTRFLDQFSNRCIDQSFPRFDVPPG